MISVVVATFNCASTLGRCLESVESQTHPDREVVVVDGGSTDGTLDVLRAHEGSLASWSSEPDRGVYDAWNKALTRVRGEWVFFLGADDYFWAPDVLERLAPALSAAYPPTRVVYGRVNAVNARGTVLETRNDDWPRVRRRFRRYMALCHQGVFHHRSLFEERGRFDPTFRVMGDYDLLLRELVDHDAVFVPQVVCAMQQGGLSSDPANAVAMVDEAVRARRNAGVGGYPLGLARDRLLLRARAAVARTLGPRAAGVLSDAYRLLTGKPRLWTR